MKIIREGFKNEEKKLKKYFNEKDNYEKLIRHIRNINSYAELCVHPFSSMFGFERLKYFDDEYYSFNLGKKGGVIRLIFKIDKVNNAVILEYISMKHYEDFKRKKGIMG